MEIKITTSPKRRYFGLSFLVSIFKCNISVVSFILLFFVNAYNSTAQITQRAFTSGTAATTSLTIAKPTGVVAGDVMIANIATQGNNTAPFLSGWTLISSSALATSASRNGAVLYRVATATETASYVFALGTGATAASGAIVAFYNVDISGATPFDVAPGTISSPAAAGTAASATAITTVSANAAVIMFAQAAGGVPTWSAWNTTSPGALTEIYDVQATTNASVGAAWLIKPTAGTTGTGTASLASTRNGSILIALKPQPPCVTASITTQSTLTQTKCIGTPFSAISVTAAGTGLTYQWYSTTTNSNATGSLISGATAATYTPPSSVTGTTYYYCQVIATCGVLVKTPISGAFIVNAAPTASISYPQLSYCSGTSGNAAITITGQTNGTFSSTPSGLTFLSNGDVNIGASTAGTYTITYTFSNGTCTGTATASLTITAQPILSCHSNTGTCISAPVIDLTTFTTPYGGTYSGYGVSGNNFNPVTAGVGTHTITYNYSSGICTNVTCSFTITVTDATTTISAIPANTYVYSGNNTNIALSSTVPGTQYTWTATSNTPSVTGFASQPTPVAGPIIQQLFNLSPIIGQVTYTITPTLIGCSGSPISVIISLPSSTFCESPGTFQRGSCIIDMGVVPQTYNNGLKPYGLIYQLLNIYKVPVYWAINPNKTFESSITKVDEADFTVDGRTFKGGAFIIPAVYIPQVQSEITNWVNQGVVVYYSNTAFVPPVFDLLTRIPNAVLDFANGATIQNGFYVRSGIPSSAYTLSGVPSIISNCDDIYVLPHAEPERWTQLYKDSLLNFINNRGWLYSSCKAVSEVENIAGMNFLSNTGLVSDTFHVDATIPYNYSLGAGLEATKIASDPFTQSVGTLDDAIDFGAETVYLPKTSWRSSTKIAIYDSNYVNNGITYPNTAAILAYGRAFGNTSKGLVLYLAGHDLAHGTEASNVAAARIYGNFILRSGIGSRPTIIPVSIPSTINSGAPVTLVVSIPATTSMIVSYEWSSDLNGIFSSQSTTTTFTAPTVDVPTVCTVQFKVVDACGRVGLYCTAILINPTITNNYIGAFQTICSGNIPATLTGSTPGVSGNNPITYLWLMSTTSSSAGFVAATGINNLQNYSPSALTQTTWFRRQVTYNAITVFSTSVQILITQAPVITTQPVTTTQSMCQGGTLNALSVGSADPSITYQWYSNTTANTTNGTLLSGSTASTYIPSSGLQGILYYYCVISNTTGCNVTSNVSGAITIFAALQITTNPSNLNQTVCQGASLTPLSVSVNGSGLTYQWYSNTIQSNSTGTRPLIPGATASTYTQTSIGTFYYYCIISAPNSGCSPNLVKSTISGAITINALPPAGINNNTATTLITCTIPSISLSATGGQSYLWSSGFGSISSVIITAPGTYTVTVTGTNGCTKDSSITITQNIAAPTIGITNNNSTAILTCTIPSISLMASTNGVGFSWNNNLGSTNPANITSPGTYVVTATGTNGCIKDTSVTITQNITPPIIGITNNSATTILNCNTPTISLSATTNGVGFSWNNGLGSGNLTNVTAPGTYIVTASGANGCTKDSSITITQNIVRPVVGIINNSATTILSCATPSINVTATGGTSYLWNNNLGVNPNQIIINQGTYTVTATGSNGCVKDSSIIITNSITGSTWTGEDNAYWDDEDNWCGGVPTITSSVLIPAGTPNDPVISAILAKVKNISIEPGAVLFLDNQTLQISGTISSIRNINAVNGNIELNGYATEQTIAGSMFAANRIRNLKISNGIGVLFSGINDTIKLTGALEFGTSNSTLNANGNLTIVSNINGTARIADLTDNGLFSGNKIIGNVTVERYIPNHTKAWQLLSSPAVGQTINAAWQEGNAPLSNTNNAGYGTIITSNLGGSLAATNALGFDIYTAPAPSMKVFNSPDSSWVGVSSTNNLIANNKGYMIFVRGDRSVTAYNQIATATTLRITGELYQPVGNAPATISVAANRFESVGNPYASAIDVSKLQRNGGVQDVYYVWDPKLTTTPTSVYGLGAYQTIVRSGTGYIVVPGGGSYANGNVNIESGQAFLIRSDAVPGTLNFIESSKISGSSMVTRNTNDIMKIGVGLSVINAGNPILLDGTLIQFDNDYSNNIDSKDAVKLFNGSSESISIVHGTKKLVAEQRANVLLTDTIFYNINQLRRPSYQLNFEIENLNESGLTARLIDKFMGTSTVLNSDENSLIPFAITSDASSYAADRFYIVLDNVAALPVTIKSLSANRNSDESVSVNWKVDNETSIEKYVVERSSDGRTFIAIAAALPIANNGGSAGYLYLDETAFNEINFYRIKALSISGMIQYSNIVKVTAVKSNPSIKIIPNPVVDKVAYINFSNVESGKYQVEIYNQIGQQIFKKKLDINGGFEIISLPLDINISSGNYKVKICAPNGNHFTQQILIK